MRILIHGINFSPELTGIGKYSGEMARSDEMKSKWNGQACPICAAGVLHDGSKTVAQDYKGHPYQAQVRGAFCDKCDEAILVYDASEEAAWLAFRDQVDRQAEVAPEIRTTL